MPRPLRSLGRDAGESQGGLGIRVGGKPNEQ